MAETKHNVMHTVWATLITTLCSLALLMYGSSLHIYHILLAESVYRSERYRHDFATIVTKELISERRFLQQISFQNSAHVCSISYHGDLISFLTFKTLALG